MSAHQRRARGHAAWAGLDKGTDFDPHRFDLKGVNRGGDHQDEDGWGDDPDRPGDPGAPIDGVLAELLLARPGMLDDPMAPLSPLLIAAGLEVMHGDVLLTGAPHGPDEVWDLSPEEIRWFTLARGFLWRREADLVSAEELDRLLTVVTLSSLVLERTSWPWWRGGARRRWPPTK